MTATVDVARIGGGSHQVGRLTLNAPKTLNSLTLDMVEIIAEHLEAWRDDDRIAAIIIDADGEKAFCAGGDVQALRNSSLATPGGPCIEGESFFAREYRMNYMLHTYPKPIIGWGHGVVMGGGLGILAGCAYRVVSERTRIGMPEVTIALFPDVGGSWFLNRMPGQVGRFLALTAASINATDALFCGLGTHFLAHAQHDAFLAQLAELSWSADTDANRQQVETLLASMNAEVEQPPAQIEPELETINSWMAGEDLSAIVSRVKAWEGDNTWLARARDGLAGGSCLAAAWIFRQLNDSRDRDLRQVFESELILAANILRHPEFAEGVRALLVDKDRNPAWTYASIDAVPAAVLDSFFVQPEAAQMLDLPE